MTRRGISPELRAEISRLLQQGLDNKAVSARTGAHHTTVAKVRRELNLPVAKSGRKSYPTLAEAFRARTEPVAGGHVRWKGGFNGDQVPMFVHEQRLRSAYRIAFTLRTGRDPSGQARPGCDFPHCVEPRHVEDQAERNRNRDNLAAIFGGASA
ncbi:MAG: helix-turn-helix domain-containing protein [Streptomyces sp.]|nr:helix-turn-helix domain-containing protein [Streptomyces sp.]